jgi:hypothetical protein
MSGGGCDRSKDRKFHFYALCLNESGVVDRAGAGAHIGPMRSFSRTTLFMFLCLIACAAPSRAQTGAELLLKPLVKEDEFAEGRADALLFNQGQTNRGDDFQLRYYQTSGRIRENEPNLVPRFGWDVKYYDLDTDDPVLPDQLLDSSAAVGLGVKDFHGWRAGLSLGLGYAGDKPFAEGDAWYGKATLAFGKAITEKSTLGVFLDYDGNRPFAPDIPLPGFGYLHQFDPHLSYVVGAPLDSITWKPNDQIKVEATYLMPARFKGEIDYEPVRHLIFYGGYQSVQDAFHVESLPGDRRLLFDQQRAEVGLRFAPTEEASFIAAIGYAFDGQFNSGFDERTRHGVADISDEPYLRVGFEARF